MRSLTHRVVSGGPFAQLVAEFEYMFVLLSRLKQPPVDWQTVLCVLRVPRDSGKIHH